ncbi:MAG: SufB/SufD family protein [Candidatus Methanomethylophilaceae archaeon]|jgi:Fe-S cluster assembly scaffold protein SufB|nr:hypothetical protein AOA81_01150 [Methanomassiliicoccales archaeon RumEn M2]MDD2532460.1 SufD family Fe-S cluster assembly protein [Candidatus Methanomethylophilaceae archaeon]MDI9379009.1 SufD family Fe-S cluster assembly protein [Candidatus Thermoplasmatota archaeon]
MQNGETSIKKALDKKAQYGPDIDLNKYRVVREQKVIDKLEDAPKDIKERMESVGITSSEEHERDGSIMFIDNKISHCSNKAPEGVEIMPVKKAMEKYEWLKDYSWKLVSPDKDKYTAKTYEEDADGTFVRVKAGYHVKNPIQACMMLGTDKGMQTLHNIFIIEEGAHAEMISGCTTGSHADDGLHIGVSEIYVKEGAYFSYSMIHNWGPKTSVRPRTGIQMEKDSRLINNYVILNPVATVQSAPTAWLNGEGASCQFNTICLAHPGADIDSGGTVILNAPGTGAEIVSRSITKGGRMMARGRLVGNSPRVKAHLECKSIVLQDGGQTLAVPELETSFADVDMTHEAAVGKIARDQIEYLMTRGLSEDQAVGMIIRGFLVGGIKGLPKELTDEINDAIERSDLGQ